MTQVWCHFNNRIYCAIFYGGPEVQITLTNVSTRNHIQDQNDSKKAKQILRKQYSIIEILANNQNKMLKNEREKKKPEKELWVITDCMMTLDRNVEKSCLRNHRTLAVAVVGSLNNIIHWKILTC